MKNFEAETVDNLKKCPFCGGDAVLLSGMINAGIVGDDEDNNYECVVCQNCHAGTETLYGKADKVKQKVIELWNKRVDENAGN